MVDLAIVMLVYQRVNKSMFVILQTKLGEARRPATVLGSKSL